MNSSLYCNSTTTPYYSVQLVSALQLPLIVLSYPLILPHMTRVRTALHSSDLAVECVAPHSQSVAPHSQSVTPHSSVALCYISGLVTPW